MFDFVEETLDQVSVSVEVRAEGRYVLAVRHGFDVGPRAAFVEASPQLIAVVGTVDQKRLALDESVEHIGCVHHGPDLRSVSLKIRQINTSHNLHDLKVES